MKDTLIQHIDNTQSTNKLLSSWILERADTEAKIPPFFALWADFQTAGRGMGSNHWFSEAGKNLLGAFWQPGGVLCDTSLLSTLPEEIFVDGCAEILKYALI